MDLGEAFAAAFGHPINHEENNLIGQNIRLRSAQTEEAISKAKQAQLMAQRTESENIARPHLGNALIDSPTPEERIGAFVNAGGAVDAASAAANMLGEARFRQTIANPDTDNATRQYANAAITGKYISPVEAVNGAGYVDPIHPELGVQATPVAASTIAKNNASAELSKARAAHPELFSASGRAGGATFQPDPDDEVQVVRAQRNGQLPTLLPRAYAMSPALYHQLAETVRDNPGFNAADFGISAAATKAASVGTFADRVTALNSTYGHLAQFRDAFTKLGNGDLQPLNSIANELGIQVGSDPQVAVRQVAQLLSAELGSTYMKTGGTKEEREGLEESFKDSLANGQADIAVATARHALAARGAALEQQYSGGPGNAHGRGNFRQQRLLPAARAAMDEFYPSAPAATAADPVGGATPSYKTVEEAEAAGHKAGDTVIIAGQKGKLH